MGRKKTEIFVNFDFEDGDYLYEVPLEQVIDGIRYYFYMKYFVKLDGTDTSVWNMCCNGDTGLHIIDDITDSDTFIDYIKEKYVDYAREEFEEEKEFDREYDRHFSDEDTDDSEEI